MSITARRSAPPEEDNDPIAEASARAVEAFAALVAALAAAPKQREYVRAAETGVARPCLRRWELAGKVRVIKAGREKLYSTRDIAALGAHAPKPELAKSPAVVDLASIAAQVRGRR